MSRGKPLKIMPYEITTGITGFFEITRDYQRILKITEDYHRITWETVNHNILMKKLEYYGIMVSTGS